MVVNCIFNWVQLFSFNWNFGISIDINKVYKMYSFNKKKKTKEILIKIWKKNWEFALLYNSHRHHVVILYNIPRSSLIHWHGCAKFEFNVEWLSTKNHFEWKPSVSLYYTRYILWYIYLFCIAVVVNYLVGLYFKKIFHTTILVVILHLK